MELQDEIKNEAILNQGAYHIIERELCPLSHDVSIDGDHCAAVVIQTISITAFLIGEQINPAAL